MIAAREQFRQAGVDLLIVCQANPDVLADFLWRESLPVPVVCDPERRLYQQLGLGRVRFWSFLRPDVLLGYLRLMVRGTRPQKPYTGEDVYQLGGDFVLNRRGQVVFAHRSRTATDRPGIAEILRGLPER